MSTVYIRFAARGLDAAGRSPLIERLIARAARPMPVADWRADAFRVLAGEIAPPPIATAALNAAVREAGPGAARGAWVCVATPVHWAAGMSSVTMPPDGLLDLHTDEAQRLALDFNRVFAGASAGDGAGADAGAGDGVGVRDSDGDGVRLRVGRAGVLLCVFDSALEVRTVDPEAMVGRSPWGFEPTGPDGPRLRRLMSEIEMWLFDCAVNRERRAAARPPISGLWLWGGGATDAPIPAVRGWTAGRDPLFCAFGAAPHWPSEPEAGVLVAACEPGSPGWPEIERRWLEPAAAALRSGDIAALELSAGERGVRVAHRLWRSWRRARPWWESFGLSRGEQS